MSHHMNYTAGGLITAGGIMGYAKARSVPSLVAGLVIGGGFFLSGHLISQNIDPRMGHDIALASGVVLLGAMGPKFVKTRKVMPAGLASGVGLLTSAYNAKKCMEWREPE